MQRDNLPVSTLTLNSQLAARLFSCGDSCPKSSESCAELIFGSNCFHDDLSSMFHGSFWPNIPFLKKIIKLPKSLTPDYVSVSLPCVVNTGFSILWGRLLDGAQVLLLGLLAQYASPVAKPVLSLPTCLHVLCHPHTWLHVQPSAIDEECTGAPNNIHHPALSGKTCACNVCGCEWRQWECLWAGRGRATWMDRKGL